MWPFFYLFCVCSLWWLFLCCGACAAAIPQEFFHGVEYTLQMHLTPRQLDLLRKRFFPYPTKRLTPQEFCRVMDSAPHFESSAS